MKKIKSIYFLSVVFLIAAFTCEKMPEKETSFTGNILEITCGGTVIQFIKTDEMIGETWDNYFVNPSPRYTNCVLAGNLPSENFKKGDTIYFNSTIVSAFKSGIFCDIGGLPETKIELSNVVKNK